MAVVRQLAEKILVAHAGDPTLLSLATELQQRANGLVNAGPSDQATKDAGSPDSASASGSVVPWWDEHLKLTELAQA
ncbi:hypothetical protein D3C84_1231350 [compost metagenome]